MHWQYIVCLGIFYEGFSIYLYCKKANAHILLMPVSLSYKEIYLWGQSVDFYAFFYFLLCVSVLRSMFKQNKSFLIEKPGHFVRLVMHFFFILVLNVFGFLLQLNVSSYQERLKMLLHIIICKAHSVCKITV